MKLTIATRVTFGLVLITLCAIAMGLAGASAIGTLGSSIHSITEADDMIGLVSDGRAASLGVRRFEKDFIINAGDAATQQTYLGEWREELARLEKTVAAVKERSDPGAELEAVGKARASIDRYAAGFQVVVAAAADPNLSPRDLNTRLAPVKDEIRTVIATLDEIGREHDQEVHALSLSAAATQRRAGRTIWLLLAAVVAGAAAATWLTTRAVLGTVRGLLSESDRLTDAVARGDLSVRGSGDRVGPEFRPIIEGMNDTMDAFAKPIAVTADYVTRISKGDMPPQITDRYEGEFNGIKEALNGCIGSLSGLVGEMNRVSGEHDKGEIDVAVDVQKFQGVYRTMAEGVNDMVGAHIAVTKQAIGVFAEFGKGNFDATLEALPGKRRFMNDAVDQVRKNLKDLIAELNRMSREHDAGDIDAVIDTQRFVGEFRVMAEGMNRMASGHIAVNRKAMVCVAEFGRGNFEAPLERFPGKQASINETIEQVRANLKALVADANGLVQAAVMGKLSTRADASRHAGDFRKIVDGVNKTLDAVLAPIDEAATVLEQLAQRDLRARVRGEYQGDHATIKASVNTTAEALHDALAQVAQAVDQVSSASTQIASSSQAVASGASEQAAALQETTTSIESVSGMTRHTADSAQQANLLAQAARSAASSGSTTVERMQGAMGKIKASAEGTSQIIRDINDIAFQTNLLALNAAVEAARAGEAGRGFAVVAEEVRSLALRAKEAASKTEELIRQSVKEAGEGEVTAREVAGKLTEIAGGVAKVSDLVAEIASSAREQSTGIEQVSRSVAEMDKVTQQNAASAEESSSAASELSGQAEELAAMVAAFQLSSEVRTSAARSPAPVRSLPPASLPAAAGAQPRPPRSEPPPSPRSRNPRRTRADDVFPMVEHDLKDF